MKKIMILVVMVTFVLGLFLYSHSFEEIAQKDGQKIYLFANDLSRNPSDPAYLSLYYRFRKTYFSLKPHSGHPIVFLGDSITDEGNWSKLFPSENVENRGIGGDTTAGVLNRIDQVIALQPSQIFLMIGTNDLCFNRSIDDTVANYQLILSKLQAALPDTPIYIESVLPFNEDIFPSNNLRTNTNIKLLDNKIRKLAMQTNCIYIDLTPRFTDENGMLFSKYTEDGLHLNDEAYRMWRDQIRKFVLVS